VKGENDPQRSKKCSEAASVNVVRNGNDDHSSYQLNQVDNSNNNKENNSYHQSIHHPITITDDNHQRVLLYQRALHMKNFAIQLKQLKTIQKQIIMEIESSYADDYDD
jgi:hypothetical protein